MSRISRTLRAGGLIGLGLAAAGLADVGLNEGRTLYALLGRDRLVAACAPALIKQLSDQGFSPQDMEFDGRPSLQAMWGRGRSLDADFSFQDGAAATRIDGTMRCVVDQADVRIVFRTNARPVRIG